MACDVRAIEPTTFGILGVQVSARAALAGLFIVLVVVELVPIVFVMATDALWFMWVAEEFSATFWPPLRPLLSGSFFYHYFGFAYYTAIRPAHWLTAWWLGSPEVTIAYTQVYGTIIKAAFSAATIALAGWVLATRALRYRTKLAVLLFMLALLIANPDFYWIYHGRVSYALSVKLFATALLILTLMCAERVTEDRAVPIGMTTAVGAIGGVLFFEHLLYFPLVIYPVLLIAATTPRWMMLSRATLVIAVALIAALAVLAAYYVGDIESMIGAVSSHVIGLASGNPIIQMGHHEHFVVLFLNRNSVYFACHVILVAGALITLVMLMAYVFFKSSSDRTMKVIGLLLLGHAFAMGAYIWPLLKHGTNAVVYAATIESLFFIATISMSVAAVRPMWLARLAAATVGVAAAVVAAHSALPPYALSRVDFAAIGAAVRDFDEALNEIGTRYAIIDGPAFYTNDHVLFWILRASEAFKNTASGLGGPIDDRHHGDVQRQRHPRYRFWTSHHVADVSDRCYALAPELAPGPPGRKWACYPLPFAFAARYANVYATDPPVSTDEAWIEPLPADVADPVRADRLARVTVVPYREVRGHARTRLLNGYPTLGVLGEPLGPNSHVRWSILPLRPEDLALFGSPETKTLIEHDHVPFLASATGYRTTNYLIWLPKSPNAGVR
jgi:hypothetical protein